MIRNLNIKSKLRLILFLLIVSGVLSGFSYYYFLYGLHRISKKEYLYFEYASDYYILKSAEDEFINKSIYRPVTVIKDSVFSKRKLDLKYNDLLKKSNEILSLDQVSDVERNTMLKIRSDISANFELFTEINESLVNRQDIVFEIFNELTTDSGKYESKVMNHLAAYLLNGSETEISDAIEWAQSMSSERSAYQEKMVDLFHKLNKIDRIIGNKGGTGKWDSLNETSDEIVAQIKQLEYDTLGRIDRNTGKTAIIILISVVFMTLLVYIPLNIISRSILKSIDQLVQFIKELSTGRIPDLLVVQQNDEIGNLSENLNQFISDLHAKNDFAKAISGGNLESNYVPIGDADELGLSLIELQSNLRKTETEEKTYKDQEEKRQWMNEGMTLFTDILRLNNDNIPEFTYQCLINLVKYLKAEQGEFFMVNAEERNILDLISAFASDRRKYINRKIEFGEGLVGTCALEKEKIYLTDIPKDYIAISSGLGTISPTSLILLPVKDENEILGVIEISSLHSFAPHEIEFAEKVTDSIASTLVSVKMNQQTRSLLEQTRFQADEMVQKEEEMRQNMEELQATQEESHRRETELTGILQNLSRFIIMFYINKNGEILQSSDLVSEYTGLSKKELLNKYIWEIQGFSVIKEDVKKILNEQSGRELNDKISFQITTGNISGNMSLYISSQNQNEFNKDKLLILGYLNS